MIIYMIGIWCGEIKYCSSFRLWCLQTRYGEYYWVSIKCNNLLFKFKSNNHSDSEQFAKPYHFDVIYNVKYLDLSVNRV